VEFEDYVMQNLEDFEQFGWCQCAICGKLANKRGNKNEATCSYECMGELRKTWTGEKSPRFGAILTEKTKQKISVSNTGKEGMKGVLNPSCRAEVREQISKTRIERGVAVGNKNPMFGKTHTPEAIEKIFSHRPMNKLEKMIAIELDKAGIPYYFQFFIVEDNICKSYDFKIKMKPLIIEVDGDFWHGNPNKTNHYEKVGEVRKNDALKEAMASRRGYKVIRLWESDIKKDPSIVLKHIM
jgi:G:T-mismatch repair DNA endonuclease (very short patch repair protein)